MDYSIRQREDDWNQCKPDHGLGWIPLDEGPARFSAFLELACGVDCHDFRRLARLT